jgi:O-antigen ligase
MVFFSLIAVGLIVLLGRHISWSHLIRNNVWLLLFVFYCGISITWSDFPEVAFKRWVKALGDLIMVMILLSDPQPLKAVETLVRRCAYILIPFSILFIKYYPAYGRVYSEWTGEVLYTGVTTNKNLLGYICFVCGLFFVYTVFGKRGRGRLPIAREEMVISVAFVFMVVWLFGLADAKTALSCLFISSLIALGLGFGTVRRYFGRVLIVSLVLYGVLHLWLGVTEILIESLGRNTTLTGRTELWPVVLEMANSPMLGEGFESFWLGERLKKLQDMWYFKPNQAHNGYIEMYLNLGWIGLLIFAGVVVSCYKGVRETLMRSFDAENAELDDFSRIGMGYLIAYLIFNVTDASFKPLNFLFVWFLIFTMRYPSKASNVPQLSTASLARAERVNEFGTLGVGI